MLSIKKTADVTFPKFQTLEKFQKNDVFSEASNG